jgi:hypothetical protein
MHSRVCDSLLRQQLREKRGSFSLSTFPSLLLPPFFFFILCSKIEKEVRRIFIDLGKIEGLIPIAPFRSARLVSFRSVETGTDRAGL